MLIFMCVTGDKNNVVNLVVQLFPLDDVYLVHAVLMKRREVSKQPAQLPHKLHVMGLNLRRHAFPSLK
jgi:hypothetical protein